MELKHTSIIIGFPSFIAFFKSPANPGKQMFQNEIIDQQTSIKCQEKLSLQKEELLDFSHRSQNYHDYLKINFKIRHQLILADLLIGRLPLRTILHSLQNSVINSSEELKSRAQTGVDVNGALDIIKRENKHSKIVIKL
jgi:hypothetical protein